MQELHQMRQTVCQTEAPSVDKTHNMCISKLLGDKIYVRYLLEELSTDICVTVYGNSLIDFKWDRVFTNIAK